MVIPGIKPTPSHIVVPQGGSYTGQTSGGGAGGTYVDSGGNIISAGRGSTVGKNRPSSGYHPGSEEPGYINQPANIQSQIRQYQEDKARRVLGQIRNVIVDSSRSTRTFIGYDGRRYTFPLNDISFSGGSLDGRTAIYKGKVIQTKGYFGGIPSKESQVGIKIGGGVKYFTSPKAVSKFQQQYQDEFDARIYDTLQRQLDNRDFYVTFGRIPEKTAYSKLFRNLNKNELRQYLDIGEYPITKEGVYEKYKGMGLNQSNDKYRKIGPGEFYEKQAKFFKRLASIPTKMFSDIGKGYKNIVDVAIKTPHQMRVASSLLRKTVILKDLLSRVKKNPSKANVMKAMKAVSDYRSQSNRLKIAVKQNKEAVKLLKKEETKTFLLTAGLASFGSVGTIAGGATRLISSGILEGVGGYATYQQAKETIKNPTVENIGGVAFFGIPTSLSILSVLRKFSFNFRPIVKNASTARIALKQKLRGYNDILRKRNKYSMKVVKDVKKEIPKIKRAIKTLTRMINDKQVIKARDFNPIISTKYLKEYQGSIKTLYHVSGEPKINKLLGNKIDDLVKMGKKLPNEKVILRNILKKAGRIEQPKRLGRLSERTKLDKIVVDEFKKNKVIIGGGKALNIQSSWFRRRFTADIDGKVIGNNARLVLERIAGRANKYFKEDLMSPSLFSQKNRFLVKQSGHKGTYKLIDTMTKKTLIELTNAKAKEVSFVRNSQGLRISDKLSLLKGKANSLSKSERFLRKGKVDIKDVGILTNGKVKLKDIFRPNSRDIFEIVETKTGAGKSRKIFKEFFFFEDTEAALGYGKGKKYSILIESKEKISRYPKELRDLINRASKGKLSQRQSIILRKRLVAYAKTTKAKTLIGTRTASQIRGEREFIKAAETKLKRIGKYKTFDNDLRSFIEVGIMSKRLRTEKLSFFNKLKNAYAKNPFQRLSLRLRNPDILLVRKYAKLIRKEINLNPKQRTTFNKIVMKLLLSKKAGARFKLSYEENELGRVFKDINKMTDLQKKIISMSELRKRYNRGLKYDDIAKVRIKSNVREISRKDVKAIRSILVLPKRITDRILQRNPERAILRALIPIRQVLRAAPDKTRTPIRGTTRITTRTPDRTIIRTPPRVPTRFKSPTRGPTRTRKPYRQPVIPKRHITNLYHKSESAGRHDIVKLAKKKRRFIYLSDLISILYNRVATSRQARALKMVGRYFTGLEERRIVA